MQQKKIIVKSAPLCNAATVFYTEKIKSRYTPGQNNYKINSQDGELCNVIGIVNSPGICVGKVGEVLQSFYFFEKTSYSLLNT